MSKLKEMAMVTAMLGGYTAFDSAPRVRTVTQCKRVQKKRKGKKVKCKYHGGCDGYRTSCKWAIRR